MKHLHRHIYNFKNRLRRQLMYMVFFSVLFLSLSIGIKYSTDFYYRYFDATNYYKIDVPVPTDKSYYQPCKEVNLFMHRESQIESQGDAVVALTLIKADNMKKRVYQYSRKIVIRKSHETMIVPFILPCDIETGKYYFEGDIRYTVREVQKSSHYYTNIFYVAVEQQKEATPSGVLLPIQ